MKHLDDHALAGAAEGELDAAAAAHLVACAECDARVRGLRDVLQAVASVDAPEPSPLFWDHFPARVGRALDEPAARTPWFTPARWAFLATAAAIVVLIVGTLPGNRPPVSAPAPVAIAVVEEAPLDTPADDMESDEAWALVRSVAEDFGYDEARNAGLAPRAGSIETAAMELSPEERAELARLIEQELKRAGA